MLYERSIRTCYENSIAKFIENIQYAVDCTSDSLQKKLQDEPLGEEDFLKLATDAILFKRMENKILLKISLVFNKETSSIELSPPISEWLKDLEGLIHHNMAEISFVPCFSANEIGNAREDSKVHIFEENDPYILEKI